MVQITVIDIIFNAFEAIEWSQTALSFMSLHGRSGLRLVLYLPISFAHGSLFFAA